jgi:hypothetical protein
MAVTQSLVDCTAFESQLLTRYQQTFQLMFNAMVSSGHKVTNLVFQPLQLKKGKHQPRPAQQFNSGHLLKFLKPPISHLKFYLLVSAKWPF